MIAGLDPSTTRIGYAEPRGELKSIESKAKADDRARRLHELDRQLSTALSCWPPRPRLVVLEGPAPHSPGKLSLIRQAEVRGIILLRLFELGIAFVELTPSNLKRFATGNGAADKDRMVAAAEALGATPANHDEADAYHLRRFGLAAYGKISPTEGHELDALANAGVKWPHLGEETT